MANGYEFTPEEIEQAFRKAGGRCECCGKQLSWSSSRVNGGRGQWEAHHGSRSTPVILCTGGPENCHLNCGHNGNYRNRGITPRVHKGSWHQRPDGSQVIVIVLKVIPKIWDLSNKIGNWGISRNWQWSLGDCSEIPPANEAAHWPPTVWPPRVVQRHPVCSHDRVYLAWCTSEIWYEINGSPVPPRTLRERSVPGNLPWPSPIRIRDQKSDLPHCATDMKDILAKKGDRSAMMAIKK